MVLAAKQTQLARNELKNATLPEKQVGALSMLTSSSVEREADRKAAKKAQQEELLDGMPDQLYVGGRGWVAEGGCGWVGSGQWVVGLGICVCEGGGGYV